MSRCNRHRPLVLFHTTTYFTTRAAAERPRRLADLGAGTAGLFVVERPEPNVREPGLLRHRRPHLPDRLRPLTTGPSGGSAIASEV
ncbi:hypothetical protein SAMN04489717_3289 [Actinopolymorpha singaporensis]|uniref:Uncharacterized protein n=1 Tax=Actinopolymorpha singaporensis TaxID=117157 RepID=A0A1H1TQL2_9ACTN|nr:hypothetical protein SAMN04489717_3289 [Actinopolymorpha singaporensis]